MLFRSSVMRFLFVDAPAESKFETSLLDLLRARGRCKESNTLAEFELLDAGGIGEMVCLQSPEIGVLFRNGYRECNENVSVDEKNIEKEEEIQTRGQEHRGRRRYLHPRITISSSTR